MRARRCARIWGCGGRRIRRREFVTLAWVAGGYTDARIGGWRRAGIAVSERAGRAGVAPVGATTSGPSMLGAATAVGVAAACAVLLEAAVVPGIVLGGAAALVPRLVPRLLPRLLPGLLPRLGRGARAVLRAPRQTSAFRLKRSAAKTITYRTIVTALDFSTNYLVLGEFATAAGLSGISLVAGPFFYFVHEASWNRLGAGGARAGGRWGAGVSVKVPVAGPVVVNRAVAKTVTFRTFASVSEFTTNYLVVGDVATAATLSAVGFVLGPFVYYGHEMAWDRLGARRVGG